MAISRAIFKLNGGRGALLCTACHGIIKIGNQFSEVEKLASEGVVTLVAQYCDEHKYLEMHGMERKREILRKGIKEQLREGLMGKNVLNIEITRPTQELVIMRGIPGSGKSTKAKTLVGKGIIHSTDDLIEATGDYSGYFKKMVDSGDWSEHGRMHKRNFINAKKSMKEGVSPVVIDNTNIKAVEPQKYIDAALKLGLDESNITIVDVGDGGVSAEVLAERNTHNVPLKTIKRMISSHKGVGPLTVKKILEAKGGVKSKPSKVLYSGVMLDDESKSVLLKQFASVLPEGWKPFAHHMTTTFGKPLENREDIDKEIELEVIALGISDKAMAVRVSGYPTTNEIPHITIAVNTAEGGKPYDSNKITNWGTIDLGGPLKVYGILKEVMS